MQENEKSALEALDCAGHGVWDWNAMTNEVYFSEQWKRMLGYEPEDISNKVEEWSSRVHPDHFNQCIYELASLFSGETMKYYNVHRMLCKDGTYKWILAQGSVIERNEKGLPVRIVGTHTDIHNLCKACSC